MSLDKITIAKKYSKALYDVAVEKGQVSEVLDDLNQLKQVLNDHENLGKILTDKGLKQDQKQQIIDLLVQDASSYVKNLIKMTFDYGRMTELSAIIDEFNHQCDEANGVVKATVISAIALSDDQINAMQTQFAKRLNVKKVILDSQVDDSIIGGAIIKTDSLIYDGSIQTQINQIKQRLVG